VGYKSQELEVRERWPSGISLWDLRINPHFAVVHRERRIGRELACPALQRNTRGNIFVAFGQRGASV
jgi:hypothetical protein